MSGLAMHVNWKDMVFHLCGRSVDPNGDWCGCCCSMAKNLVRYYDNGTSRLFSVDYIPLPVMFRAKKHWFASTHINIQLSCCCC